MLIEKENVEMQYKTLVLAFVLVVVMGMPCLAQDVELPFAWEGKGIGSHISEGGTKDFDFKIELSIDEQGMFKGQSSNEDGEIKIQHVFASEKKSYDFPGFFSRNVVIVLMFNEDGDSPMVSILNGRVLVDKFFYGEMMLTKYEAGSDAAKALGIGNPQVTLMEGDELPWDLKSTLKKCFPFGSFKIEGDFKAAAESTALFNGKDFDGWYIWSKDGDADPKDVWTIKDGEIWCTGVPTGFLRTAKEYSDYKLTFDWRWPEAPGNSGVLLHMTKEEKVWPLCMEAQLMHDRAGDLIGMDCEFNTYENKKGRYAKRMNESNEKKPGGWNSYEIISNGDTMELKINGELQNKGTGLPLQKGYIGFQSEGVPIILRNIKLTSLK
jgi:3-keto-disaccharide hydrolase